MYLAIIVQFSVIEINRVYMLCVLRVCISVKEFLNVHSFKQLHFVKVFMKSNGDKTVLIVIHV